MEKASDSEVVCVKVCKFAHGIWVFSARKFRLARAVENHAGIQTAGAKQKG